MMKASIVDAHIRQPILIDAECIMCFLAVLNEMNGDYPSKTLKRVLETALSQLDRAIQGIAIVTKGTIEVYNHDWPIRSVEVHGSDGIYRRISVTPIELDTSVENPAFCFQIMMDAWKDEGEKHLHWHCTRTKLKKLPKDFRAQFAMLNDCWSEVAEITIDDLEA